MSIYDFKVKDAQGAEVELSEYKGKVQLIVNTATGCGRRPISCADQLAKAVRNVYNATHAE